jgi:glycosyltransferase involved in cell wall biosynthesis
MSVREQIRVSVIIASGRKSISETVKSLKKQDYNGKEYEVIVVTDKDDIVTGSDFPVKKLMADSQNPARKRNIGAGNAAGEVLAFIDDDAAAPENWLSTGCRILSENSGIAGLGGPNLLPENAHYAERLTDAVMNTPFIGSGHPGYSDKKITRAAKAGEVHLSNFFVRKNVFNEAGGFNENIGYGCEDTEFIYRVKKMLGKEFLYCSQVFIYHHRRNFGLDYAKQRFHFRVNNGMLTVAYPGLYFRSAGFCMAVAMLAAAPLLMLFAPSFMLWLLAIYFGLLFIYTAVKKFEFMPLLPLAVFFHHAVYEAGIFTGLVYGIFSPSKIRKIKDWSRK